MVVARVHRHRRALRAALLAPLLAGCAAPTPYQAAVDGYGYSEQQLENNRYRVTFSGNEVTPRVTVQNYLLYRAAEVTVAQGHDYFTIVDQDLERSTTYYGSGFNNFGWPGYYGRGWYGPGYGDYTAYPIDSYTAYADIVMADGEKPAGEVKAYDAHDVLRQLLPRIELPEDDA
jgi:hypothetical protein